MVWSMLRAQARIELMLMLRRGEGVLLTLIVPVALLLFMASTNVFDIELSFLVPGLISLAVISSAMVSLAIATGFERKYLVLKRLGATPLPRSVLIAAKALAVAALEILQLALILTVAVLVFDYEPTVSWVGLATTWILGTTAFAGIGMLVAGTLRAEATLATVNGLYVIMLGLGGIMFDVASLPSGLRFVADALPAAALSDAFRWALSSGSNSSSLVVVGAWAVIAPLLAARLFTWEEK